MAPPWITSSKNGHQNSNPVVHVTFNLNCSEGPIDTSTAVVTFNGEEIEPFYDSVEEDYCDPETDHGSVWAELEEVPLVVGVNVFIAEVCEFGDPEFQSCAEPDTQLVTYGVPSAPVVASHNFAANRPRSACVVNCFDVGVGYSPPAYVSLDAERTVPLLYSSHQAQTLHTVALAVSDTSAAHPQRVSIRLRRPNDSWVTFTNDTTILYFWASPSGQAYHAVQWDEPLATGLYQYTAYITAHWWNTSFERTVPVQFLVVNEQSSPYGAGWSIPGLQRVHVQANGSLVVTEGDGSVAYFAKVGGNYTSPPLDYSTFVFKTAPDSGYERQYIGGRKAFFDLDGLLAYDEDRFGNRTSYEYNDDEALTLVTDPAGKTITLGYDGSDKLDWIRDDPGNRTTQITINGSGDLTQIIDPAGDTTLKNLTYDSVDFPHALRRRTDRANNTWSYWYDFAGKLASDSTPAVLAGGNTQRLVTHYVATNRGLLSDPTSPNTNQGSYAYPGPAGQSHSEGSVTRPGGATSTYWVDKFGGVTAEYHPGMPGIGYSRNSNGELTGRSSGSESMLFQFSNGLLTRSENETTGEIRVLTYEGPFKQLKRDSSTVVIKYQNDTSAGEMDSTWVEGDTVGTRFTYDARGRVDSSRSPDGVWTTYYRDATTWKNADSVKTGTRRTARTYDGYGRVATTVSPGGRIDSTFYDVLNRVTRVGGPLGHKISYAYEDSLNLTKVTDAKGQIHRFYRNAIGRDTARMDPLGKSDRFTYTIRGEVSSWTNRRGQTTSFTYDGLGRDSTRVLHGGATTTYGYGEDEELGRWRWASNAEGSDTIRTVGLTTYEKSVRGGVLHQVIRALNPETNGVVVTMSRVGSGAWSRFVTYAYDSTGKLVEILETSDSSKVTSLQYTPDGQLGRVTLPMNDTLFFGHRPSNALGLVRFSESAINASHGVGYAHDADSRATEQLNAARDTLARYAYDALGRLTARRRHTASPACGAIDTTSELGSPCYTSQPIIDSLIYSYDSVGNRTDRNAVHDGANRLLRFDGDTMVYDTTGNLTFRYRLADSSVFKQPLFWNSINQLDSVQTTRSGTMTTVTYGYDGFGRRIRRTTGGTSTYYLHDRDHVVAEYTGSTLHQTYSYYPGVDRPHGMQLGSGARYYYLADGRGNIIGLVDSEGILRNSYRYGPWGSLQDSTEAVTNTVNFGGRPRDNATGLYHNRAREYDPVAGRFIRQDPIGLAGGVNLYGFAAGDPVNLRDPCRRGACACAR